MIRIALVGCGRHMKGTLISYLLRLNEYQVYACVDVNETAAQEAQLLCHAEIAAKHIEDIDFSRVDVAIVALPPNEAYKVTSFLIKENIACFVEKPPANTTSEIQNLWDLAQKHKVYVQVGFNFRYADAVSAFRNAVAEYQNAPFNASFEFKSKHPSGPQWGIEDPVAAWLYQNGIHITDFLQWIGGDTCSVSAEMIQISNSKFIISALIKHTSGSISTFKIGNLTDTFDVRAELFTSDATQIFMPNLGEVILVQQKGRPSGNVVYRTRNLDDGWGRSGHGPELKYFLNNYRHYECASPSLHDALKASKICDQVMAQIYSNKSAFVHTTQHKEDYVIHL